MRFLKIWTEEKQKNREDCYTVSTSSKRRRHKIEGVTGTFHAKRNVEQNGIVDTTRDDGYYIYQKY
jgi:hypothetical protein